MSQPPEPPHQFGLDKEACDALWSAAPQSIRVSYIVDGPVRLLAGDEQPSTAAETDELLAAANDAIDAWNRQPGTGTP